MASTTALKTLSKTTHQPTINSHFKSVNEFGNRKDIPLLPLERLSNGQSWLSDFNNFSRRNDNFAAYKHPSLPTNLGGRGAKGIPGGSLEDFRTSGTGSTMHLANRNDFGFTPNLSVGRVYDTHKPQRGAYGSDSNAGVGQGGSLSTAALGSGVNRGESSNDGNISNGGGRTAITNARIADSYSNIRLGKSTIGVGTEIRTATKGSSTSVRTSQKGIMAVPPRRNAAVQATAFNGHDAQGAGAQKGSSGHGLAIVAGATIAGSASGISGIVQTNKRASTALQMQKNSQDFTKGMVDRHTQALNDVGLPSYLAYSGGAGAHALPKTSQVVAGRSMYTSKLPGNSMSTGYNGNQVQNAFGWGNIL